MKLTTLRWDDGKTQTRVKYPGYELPEMEVRGKGRVFIRLADPGLSFPRNHRF
jgi:hypothetical protein